MTIYFKAILLPLFISTSFICSMQTDLHEAVKARNNEEVECLLKNNADNIEAKNEFGRTALILATEDGCLPIVKLLLKNGADIEAFCFSFNSLHIAVDDGRLPIVKLLLKNGADIEVVNGHEETPLHLAALRGHLPILKLLLKNGARTEATNRNGKTPLDIAKERRSRQVAELLESYKETTIRGRLSQALIYGSTLALLAQLYNQ